MRQALLAALLFLTFCKEPENYWNPKGNFLRLDENGTVNQNIAESFSLDNVPKNAEILLINFFAPECKPCIIEVPDLKNIYNKIKDNPKIEFIAIGSTLTSLSDKEVTNVSAIAPEIHKFVKGFGLPYRSYLGLTKDLRNFGLTGFPETFILEKNNKGHWFVKRRFVGMITENDVMPFLRS